MTENTDDLIAQFLANGGEIKKSSTDAQSMNEEGNLVGKFTIASIEYGGRFTTVKANPQHGQGTTSFRTNRGQVKGIKSRQTCEIEYSTEDTQSRFTKGTHKTSDGQTHTRRNTGYTVNRIHRLTVVN
jgi:hypothetical protein